MNDIFYKATENAIFIYIGYGLAWLYAPCLEGALGIAMGSIVGAIVAYVTRPRTIEPVPDCLWSNDQAEKDCFTCNYNWTCLYD